MSKKNEFIKFVDEKLMSTLSDEEIPADVALYWKALKTNPDLEKPILTESGKEILEFFQSKPSDSMWKARDIAEEMFISSRTVSGSIRKLVTDGFVEKVGQDPSVYTITNKGKEFKIDED